MVMISAGQAIVHLDDCIDGMKEIAGGSIDLIVADPPYNLAKPITGDDINDDEYIEWMASWLREGCRVLNSTGSIYVMCSPNYGPYIFPVMKDDLGLHHLNTIIWKHDGSTHGAKYEYSHSYDMILLFTKSIEYTFNMDDVRDPFAFSRFDKNNNRKGKALTDVWDDIDYLRWNHPERYVFYDKKTRTGGHPTQKPVALFNRMVTISSREGDTVLDPFTGSGTSAVSCMKLRRKYVGFEIDNKWINMIQKRMNAANNARLDDFSTIKVKTLTSFASEQGGNAP